MRVFLCAGEPSGDLHGSNLVRALVRMRHDVECIGFGGERMQAAGCRLLYPLCHLAVMGLIRVLLNAHIFLGLLWRANRFFKEQRPDAVVLIDYPGFNWWLARRARAHGIPVFYFVPPQLWAWASWRVRKIRRSVNHVLCSLPFEEAWYRERGVKAHYIGHPYFDELPSQTLDQGFLHDQSVRPGTIIGLLPGSRTQEVHYNISTLVRAAAAIHSVRPDTRFLLACYKPAHAQYVAGYLEAHPSPWIAVCTARTAEILHLAHSCIAVSGSVGLELLYHGKPSVVLYRIGSLLLFFVRRLKKSPYISLVNLLAGKEIFPEFLSDRCEATPIANQVLRWLDKPSEYAAVCQELAIVRKDVAWPGACDWAAKYIFGVLNDGREVSKDWAA